jgi:transketolase
VIPFGGTFPNIQRLYAAGDPPRGAFAHTRSFTSFTHDSIGLGEDGPTTIVEHLAGASRDPESRALIRPCDAFEVREAWRAALSRGDAPTAFALSRQKVALIDRKKFASATAFTKARMSGGSGIEKAGKGG